MGYSEPDLADSNFNEDSLAYKMPLCIYNECPVRKRAQLKIFAKHFCQQFLILSEVTEHVKSCKIVKSIS